MRHEDYLTAAPKYDNTNDGVLLAASVVCCSDLERCDIILVGKGGWEGGGEEEERKRCAAILF